MQCDLLVKGGRLIDPLSGTDARRDIAITDGRILAIEADIAADNAAKVVDAAGRIVTPGLIDLHSHVYWGGTSLGVDADRRLRPSAQVLVQAAGGDQPSR